MNMMKNIRTFLQSKGHKGVKNFKSFSKDFPRFGREKEDLGMKIIISDRDP